MRPSERAVARVLDERVVVLDTESGQYFQLDTVGSRIWRLMADGLPPERIAQRLTEEFDVDIEVARADTGSFLAELIEMQLVDGAP
jgi:hypothetical protein